MQAPTDVIIFCDGACSGNPGPGGWGVIILTPDGIVREMGGGTRATTNNRMELTAAIHALEKVAKIASPIHLYTDSQYVIRGITQWIHGWRKRGWVNGENEDVANRDLWEKLAALSEKRKKKDAVIWHYVAGHSGVPGNERCDEIAVAYSMGRSIDLYQGPVKQYVVDLASVTTSELKPFSKKTSTKKPYSYLSLLGNTPMRHATWADCERRVKGQSGAKFKKVFSKEEEEAVLKSWGI